MFGALAKPTLREDGVHRVQGHIDISLDIHEITSHLVHAYDILYKDGITVTEMNKVIKTKSKQELLTKVEQSIYFYGYESPLNYVFTKGLATVVAEIIPVVKKKFGFK